MKKSVNKRILIRLLILAIIVIAATCIFQSGYRAGHWLYEIVHK